MPGDRKRVEWDETNLKDNAEYQRLHPVTMHITEPKTPYHYVDDDVLAAEEAEMRQCDGWDENANAYAKEVKAKVLSGDMSKPTTVAPISKNGRPMLAPGTLSGELEAQRHHAEFKSMRSAVYADEGAKFKALLAQKHDDVDDEEETK